MTQQAPDTIFYHGTLYHLFGDAWWPRDHTRIQAGPPDTGHPVVGSTACYRGYVATWRILNDRLWLAHISGKWSLVDDAPILADWYSGRLILTQSGFDNLERSLSGDRWDQEVWITIEGGLMVAMQRGVKPTSLIW